ncbi:MAG: M4 family metallopeptidase [Francisellaceae bacterium]
MCLFILNADIGIGGNAKTGVYNYGSNGLPYLVVTNSGVSCWLSSDHVDTVDLQQTTSDSTAAAGYLCGNWYGDLVNGGYSAAHDAHYFAHIVYYLYKFWYGVDPLYNSDGSAKRLVIRVHYGQNYENAFWDGQTMTFGDGYSMFYPLVSLDVVSHEISHGFTQQHSNLYYYNESGSLNEAFSDMAGQAARAYLLNMSESNYAVFFPNDPFGKISWKMAETIVKTPGAALRYMNNPSMDGYSADCMDKSIAESNCQISYQDVVNRSGGNQSYIVHYGSGVFNKAFYLIAEAWAKNNQVRVLPNPYAEGVREAFNIMVLANVGYWTPTTGFSQAACDVLKATKAYNYQTSDVISAFDKVGVSTSNCSY